MPYYRCPECGLTTHSVAGYSTVGMCASCAAPLPFETRFDPAVTHNRASAGMPTNATQSDTWQFEEDVAQ